MKKKHKQNKSKKKMYIVIDGNIGSGKSTIVKMLGKYKGSVSKVQDVDNWSFLDKYYKNPKKYAYELQNQIMNSYVNGFKSTKRDNPNKKLIFESCVIASFFIFVLSLEKKKILDQKKAAQIYNDYFRDFMPYPDVLFILDVNPEDCLDRIKKRNRICESEITLDYLISINEQMNMFIEKYDKKIKIVKISNDPNKEKETVKKIQKIIKLL